VYARATRAGVAREAIFGVARDPKKWWSIANPIFASRATRARRARV